MTFLGTHYIEIKILGSLAETKNTEHTAKVNFCHFFYKW